jgi:putative copper resistance protein D
VNGPVLALNVLFFALSDTAFAVLAGCLLAVCWLNRLDVTAAVGAKAFGRLGGIFPACLAVLILGQIVRPWFAAAGMSGSGNFAANLALVPDILLSTHLGKVWCVGSVALAALLAALVRKGVFAGRQMTRPAALLIGASLVPFGCAKAASGHAAGAGDFTVAEFSMLFHVAGTAIWAGTVIASGLIVVPALAESRHPPVLWGYARLLSKTVTWALPAILLSGIYNSDRELNGSLSALGRSGWGRVLISKAAFVCLALALGAVARFKYVVRPATGERVALLVRLLRAEAIVMIVILCLSALLANTAPAGSEEQLRLPAGTFASVG